jgi:hypothetical protein
MNCLGCNKATRDDNNWHEECYEAEICRLLQLNCSCPVCGRQPTSMQAIGPSWVPDTEERVVAATCEVGHMYVVTSWDGEYE